MTIGKRFGEIEGLPDEIRSQIGTPSELVEFDEKVLIAIEQLDGSATVSEILVEVYRATGNKDLKKQAIARSLTRLKDKGMVERVSKGLYKIAEDLSEE